MKLAFVIKRLQDKNFFGGGERISFNLIRELCLRGISIDVYCQESNISVDYGIENIYFVEKNNRFNKTAEEIMHHHQREYQHIITENLDKPLDKSLIHGHSVLYRQLKARNFFERLVKRIFKPSIKRFMGFQKQFLHGNNLVIVPSNICKHDYVDYLHYDENKIKVIYPAVSMPTNINKSKNEVFTFGLSAPGFNNKGGYLVLFTMLLLKITGYKANAKIIYPASKDNIFVNFVISFLGLKNNIEFLPHQDNMKKFYSSIDCLIVPSSLETFGMVILEAMSCAVPVIISSRCGASEIIQDNINGYIFNYEKFKLISLYKKVKYILDNKEGLQDIANRGRDIAKEYNWEKYCNEFLDTLK